MSARRRALSKGLVTLALLLLAAEAVNVSPLFSDSYSAALSSPAAQTASGPRQLLSGHESGAGAFSEAR